MQSVPRDSEKNYLFTPSQDWFTHNIPIWAPLIDSLLGSLPPGHAPRALEVGSWEGRSAVYLLTKLCTSPDSLLVCIDHFDLFHTAAGKARHAKVRHNLSLTGSPHRLIEAFSAPGLMTLLQEETSDSSPAGGFDFVYLDGSHEADDTFLDAELAWRLTRHGALFILDDYEWDREPTASMHHPARGIDAFLVLHAGQFELLHKGYQVILRKTVEMRIGFLTGSSRVETLDDTLQGLEYGINIALCTDTAYAMPTAVAIRSALEKTPARRITFYIIDCGLHETDKRKIADSIPTPRKGDVTIVFRTLPPGSRGITDPTWAKIDIILTPSVLPVERVLFLDADVLIRHDLTPLWQTDLRGKLLGAARDIGYPLGHAGLPAAEQGAPYFNAGVLLLDLTRIRQRLSFFRQVADEREETTYKDQDVLNAFFATGTVRNPDLDMGWHELSIEWNAGGLGTYAAWSSPDRDAVWPDPNASGGPTLKSLHIDPAIVHFTGPVHPRMASVLNEFVQPWTSKPWGYAGAPGHPFAEEWWGVLERTAWAGVRGDGEFVRGCIEAQRVAKEGGIQEFEDRVRSTR